MKPIIVRVSRWRYVTPLVGSLAIGGLSMYALRYRPSWTAGILFVAFLMGVSLSAQLLLQSRVRLIVDTAGIFDPTWELGTVRWADVEKVFIRDDTGTELVCILLTDAARGRYRFGVVARKLSESMRSAGYGDLSVDATRLGIYPDDVFELAKRGISAAR